MQIYANFKQKISYYFEFVEIWNFVILVEILFKKELSVTHSFFEFNEFSERNSNLCKF